VTRTPAIVLRSLLPAPLRIGGVDLLPLTIGHCLVLDRLDSAALGNTLGLTRLDLFRTLYVLSHPYDVSEQQLARDREAFDAVVVGFSRSVPNIEEIELNAIIQAHLVGAFASHADVDFKPTEGSVQYGPDGNGFGWAMNLVCALIEFTHRPLAEILAMPIATAFALCACSMVRSGAEWRDDSWTMAERHEREDAAAAVKEAKEDTAAKSKGSKRRNKQ
jgi:hypothetical protein